MCWKIPILLPAICALFSVQGSSLVSVIYRQQTPPRPLCHGVIVTHKHVITTKLPLVLYSQHVIVVLPLQPNMRKVTEKFIQEHGSNISSIQLATTMDLAMIELSADIDFIYPRNPGSMPAMKTLSAQAKQLCYYVFNYRETIADNFEVTTTFSTDGCGIQNISSDGKYLMAFMSSEATLCKNDNGLPLFCDQMIIGLLSFVSASPSDSFDCSKGHLFRYVPTYNKEAEKFINKFVK